MVYDLHGNWHAGKAYALHTISSTYLGPDQFGHDKYETTRSEMGELVYRLKYKGDKSVLDQIVTLLDGIQGIEKFDYLVPVPPTKKNRPFQPVLAITEMLGKRRGVPILTTLVENTGDDEQKEISDPVERSTRLREAIKCNAATTVAGKNLLLVDDLYRSGATLAAITTLLYEKCNPNSVSVLTMTKTRSNR